jgi:hypothetical protein
MHISVTSKEIQYMRTCYNAMCSAILLGEVKRGEVGLDR